jgi:hypothetical protein
MPTVIGASAGVLLVIILIVTGLIDAVQNFIIGAVFFIPFLGILLASMGRDARSKRVYTRGGKPERPF